jgi:hypothetical protein
LYIIADIFLSNLTPRSTQQNWIFLILIVMSRNDRFHLNTPLASKSILLLPFQPIVRVLQMLLAANEALWILYFRDSIVFYFVQS